MAGMKGSDIDLVILGTVSGEMLCPSTACRVAAALGATPAGAFDIAAACSGFVYSVNVADSIIRAGRARRVLAIGCDAISSVVDYTDRTVSILFGDAAGAVVLERCDDPSKGCRYQTMSADGANWQHLYMPYRPDIVPECDRTNPIRLGNLRMNGREVYKFAVNRFREVIEDAFQQTGLTVDDVSQVICHQSNARIIESAIEKLNLPREKVLVNIDRYGNTSAGSVGLCLDELNRAGKTPDGKPFIMVAFGGGLTWASCVWNK
jgi:3-oxoacyl-[acyl-carrier-protein] synthase-3